MRRLLLAAALLLLVSAQAHAIARIQPGDYIEITLSRAGHPAVFEIELEEASLLTPFALFPPSELGTLKFDARNEDNAAVDLRGATPLPRGVYRISVSSEHASPAPFNVTLRTLGTAEDFSAHSTMETALEAELPVSAVLALRTQKDTAWYKFEVPGPGVVLVRLVSLNKAPGAALLVETDVTDGPAKSVSGGTTVNAANAGEAVRYFEAKGAGTWRVRATNDSSEPVTGDEAAMRLDIVFYPDAPDDGTAPSFVVLGTSPDDPAIQQLRLRLRAGGKKVLVTNDPKAIEKALIAAAHPRPAPSLVDRVLEGRSWLTWAAALGLFVLAAGGYGIWLWRRRGPAVS